MVKQPKVFLMDEPLSNLDAKLRIQMRVELIELQRQLKTTFVYVTHDQVEAMSMADVIVLMDKGAIQQKGSPEQIYNDPESVFIAQFIGSPAMNILPFPDGTQLGYRPEKVVMAKHAVPARYRRAGRIATREMLGSETIYKIALSDASIMVKSPDEHFAVGDEITVNVAAEHLYFFDAEGRRIKGDLVHKKYMVLAEGMSDAQ
jgi:sn-glycerol 3-phosphate transport system ATP-binding protein